MKLLHNVASCSCFFVFCFEFVKGFLFLYNFASCSLFWKVVKGFP